jgi:glutamate-1-semialdehyde 2,1-aminomutase
MNFIRARKSFLQYLRKVCTKNNIVLIFDEVMTGFRVSKAGAQHIYNVMPDLTTLGKVLGGGLPVGAFGGKREIMNHIAPLGSVYQAGTLSGNPLAMAAGLKTLEIISEKNYFRDLSKKTQYFVSRFNDICSKYKLDMSADSEGGMFGIYLTKSKLENLKDIDKSPKHIFLDFFNYMLDHGVFFAPSMYEAGFISSSHLKRDLDYTIKIFENWAKQK